MCRGIIGPESWEVRGSRSGGRLQVRRPCADDRGTVGAEPAEGGRPSSERPRRSRARRTRPQRRRPRVRDPLRALPGPDHRLCPRHGARPRSRRGHHPGGLPQRAAPHARHGPLDRVPPVDLRDRQERVHRRAPALAPDPGGLLRQRRGAGRRRSGSPREPAGRPRGGRGARVPREPPGGARRAVGVARRRHRAPRARRPLLRRDRRAARHEPRVRREHPLPRPQAPRVRVQRPRHAASAAARCRRRSRR